MEPTPDRLVVRGGPQVSLGAVRLLLPGRYTVFAEKAGYVSLEAPFEVTRDPRQVARFALERLPGLLALGVTPASGVRVSVDGTPRGVTPVTPLEVPEGEHEVLLQAEGFAPFTARVQIAGGGETQHLQATLKPDRAAVSFASDPPGAQVRVDGASVGATPLTVDLSSGDRRGRGRPRRVRAAVAPHRGDGGRPAARARVPPRAAARPPRRAQRAAGGGGQHRRPVPRRDADRARRGAAACRTWSA